MEYMKLLALGWCFASGSRSSLPSCTATASDTMISQKLYDVTMELCHLYSLLGKSHETLRLSLPSLNLHKRRSQPIPRQTFVWLLDSGNFDQTSKQGKTFFTINNEVC